MNNADQRYELRKLQLADLRDEVARDHACAALGARHRGDPRPTGDGMHSSPAIATRRWTIRGIIAGLVIASMIVGAQAAGAMGTPKTADGDNQTARPGVSVPTPAACTPGGSTIWPDDSGPPMHGTKPY